jgi:hypothetical protein
MTSERFDLVTALYVLCNDYHSGQWSRGYRLLSRINRRYRPKNIPCTRDDLTNEWESAALIYDELETKYADKL